jgi:hypothetical protein
MSRHPFEITNKGIQIYPKQTLKVYRQQVSTSEIGGEADERS